MTFDDITEDGRLWAVRYEDNEENALYRLFDQWNDVAWLRDFFKENLNDLTSYFKITDVNQAIYDTIEDSEVLQCLIMDISPDANLEKIFRPLDNSRTAEMLLGKEKARLKNQIILKKIIIKKKSCLFHLPPPTQSQKLNFPNCFFWY